MKLNKIILIIILIILILVIILFIFGNSTECIDACGNGICDLQPCGTQNCACTETIISCPEDCAVFEN